MRRASLLITLLAILGLVGMSLAAPAYAEGPKGNPAAGVTNPGNPGPEGTNGPNGNGNEGKEGKGNPGKNNPGQSQEDPSGNEPNSSPGGSDSQTATVETSAQGNSPQDDGDDDEGDADRGKPEGVGKPEGEGGDGGGGKPEDDMSGKSSGPAERSPPGNNGTIKVHDQDPSVHSDVEVRRNQPHVGCVFHLYGFHFDAGQSGSWRIEQWPPTGTRGTVVASGTWAASAEGDWQSGPITLSEGHHKLFFGTFNGHNKMKVFWVEGCAPPEEIDEEDNDNAPVTCPNGMAKNETGNCGNSEGDDNAPVTCPNGMAKDETGNCGNSEGDDNAPVTCPNGMAKDETGNCGNSEGDDNAPVTCPNGMAKNETGNCGNNDVGGNAADKVWVCHITGSGWVTINIAREGWANGHADHEGDVMAETEEGLPETCGIDEDIDEDVDEDIDEDIDEDVDEDIDEDADVDNDADIDNNNDADIVDNDVDQGSGPGQVQDQDQGGPQQNVLGTQQAPLGGVSPIIEGIESAVRQVAGVLSLIQLPSSATLTGDQGRLAVAGLALLGAAFLLLRRRTQRSI